MKASTFSWKQGSHIPRKRESGTCVRVMMTRHLALLLERRHQLITNIALVSPTLPKRAPMSAASGRPAVLGQAASTAGGDEAALRLYNAYSIEQGGPTKCPSDRCDTSRLSTTILRVRYSVSASGARRLQSQDSLMTTCSLVVRVMMGQPKFSWRQHYRNTLAKFS
jgi:hypothetical protein